MLETQVQSLGWEDPLEEEIATHSGILAWKFHGQRSLEGHRQWCYKVSDMTEQLSMHTEHTHTVGMKNPKWCSGSFDFKFSSTFIMLLVASPSHSLIPPRNQDISPVDYSAGTQIL